jgi:hypothetical protein
MTEAYPDKAKFVVTPVRFFIPLDEELSEEWVVDVFKGGEKKKTGRIFKKCTDEEFYATQEHQRASVVRPEDFEYVKYRLHAEVS